MDWNDRNVSTVYNTYMGVPDVCMQVCASGDILCFRKNMRSRRAELAAA